MSGQVGTIIEAWGMGLVHVLWMGLVWGGLTALALLAVGKENSRRRYRVALACFTVLATLPCIAVFWSFERTENTAGSVIIWDTTTGALIETVSTTSGPAISAVATPSLGWSGVVDENTLAVAVKTGAWDGITWDHVALAIRGAASRAYATLRGFSPWIAAFWVLGVLVLSMRLLGGVWQSRQYRCRGTAPLSAGWPRRVEELVARASMSRPVLVLESTLAQVPMVVGWFRPVILMPVELITGMPSAQVELLLAHELAHVKRLDPLVNLFQAVVETVLFFHPVVWWLSRELRETRELCCDDLAVAWCGGRGDYARALVHVAEGNPTVIPLAVTATGSPLRQRVERILFGAPRPVGMPWLGAVACFAIVAVGLSGLVWAEIARERPEELLLETTESVETAKFAGTVETAGTAETETTEAAFTADTIVKAEVTEVAVSAQSTQSTQSTEATEPLVQESIEAPTPAEIVEDVSVAPVLARADVTPETLPESELAEALSPQERIRRALASPYDYSSAYALSLEDLVAHIAERHAIDVRFVPEAEADAARRIGERRGKAQGINENDGGTLADILATSTAMAGLDYAVGPGYLLVSTPEQVAALALGEHTPGLIDVTKPVASEAILDQEVAHALQPERILFSTSRRDRLAAALQQLGPDQELAVRTDAGFYEKTSPPLFVERDGRRKSSQVHRESMDDVVALVSEAEGLVRWSGAGYVMVAAPEHAEVQSDTTKNVSDGESHLARALASPVSVIFDDISPAAALEFIAAVYEIDIRDSEGSAVSVESEFSGTSETVSIALDGVSLRDVLEAVATSTGARLDMAPAHIVVSAVLPKVATTARAGESPLEAVLPEQPMVAVDTPDGTASIVAVDTRIDEPRPKVEGPETSMEERLATPATFAFDDGISLAEVLELIGNTNRLEIRDAAAFRDGAESRWPSQEVPRLSMKRGSLADALTAITQSVGLRWHAGPGFVLVGTTEEIAAALSPPWPDMATLRISDSIVSEHVSAVLERWGEQTGLYFHLDPFRVGPVVGADGRPFETDGMLSDVHLNDVPLSDALARILKPLGLFYWYGKPGPGTAGANWVIQPSVWISAQEELAQIEAGNIPQHIVDAVFVDMGELAWGHYQKQFPQPDIPNVSEKSPRIISQGASAAGQGVKDAFLAALAGSPEIRADTEFISAPRVTSIDSKSWWPNNARAVLVDPKLAVTDFGCPPILPNPDTESRHCIFLRPSRESFDWNPFDTNSRQQLGEEVPPNMTVHCDDRMVDGAAEWLAEWRYPTIILDYTSIYDPPLDQPARRSAKRAGRREAALPQAGFPSPENPVEVQLHHEGVLLAVQATAQGQFFNVRLFAQYRPQGAGPVPWQALLTNYVVREGDIMGFVRPEEATGETTTLLLVRVLGNVD